MKLLYYIILSFTITGTLLAINDYSFKLNEEGLEFVKLSSSRRLILKQRSEVIIEPNITKINQSSDYVYGEITKGNKKYFILNTSNYEKKFFEKKEEFELFLKEKKLPILLKEPGILHKEKMN